MLYVAILILCVLTVIFRIQAGKWTVPGALFSLYWTTAVCLSIIIAPENYPVSWISIVWITISVFTLGIGSIIGVKISPNRKVELKTKDIENTFYKMRNLWKTVTIFSVIGFIGTLFLMNSLGKSISIFFSLEGIQTLSASVSEARYVEGFTPPLLYNICLSFNYAGALLGGMLRALKTTKISYLPFLPILMSTIIMTTKAGILFSIFLWLAGLLAMRIKIGKPEIVKKTIFQLTFSSALVTIIFIVSSLLRYSMESFNDLKFIYEKLTVYYVGFLSGYSQWFDGLNLIYFEKGFGSYTFAGLFDVLGLQTRGQGIISNTVKVGNFETNIYTVFRYIIQDFGLLGSLFFLFLIGLLSGYLYKLVMKGSYLSIPLLAVFYAQLLFSNTTTIIGYNTIVLAFLISLVYVGKNDFKMKRLIWKRHI